MASLLAYTNLCRRNRWCWQTNNLLFLLIVIVVAPPEIQCIVTRLATDLANRSGLSPALTIVVDVRVPRRAPILLALEDARGCFHVATIFVHLEERLVPKK